MATVVQSNTEDRGRLNGRQELQPRAEILSVKKKKNVERRRQTLETETTVSVKVPLNGVPLRSLALEKSSAMGDPNWTLPAESRKRMSFVQVAIW